MGRSVVNYDISLTKILVIFRDRMYLNVGILVLG
jgi:hypothetical protein